MTFLRLCSRAPWMTSRSVPTDRVYRRAGTRLGSGRGVPARLILRPMERDLRESTLYGEVEEHFRKIYGPGFGRVTEPSDPRPSPDGRWVAFTGSLWEKLEGGPKTRVLPGAFGSRGFRRGRPGGGCQRGLVRPRARRRSEMVTGCATAQLRLRPPREATDAALRPERRWPGRGGGAPRDRGHVEEHGWSPDGSRILVLAAGLHADSAGAEGSGALESEKDAPRVDPARGFLGGPAGPAPPVADRRGLGRGSRSRTRRSQRLGGGLVRRRFRGRGGLGGCRRESSWYSASARA